MGIKYFYNFCLCERDDADIAGDILSAVRKAYFAGFVKIRDKITYDSEGTSLLYDYCIEKDKPLRWTVKTPSGEIVQDVTQAAEGKYHINYYRNKALYKRLLFSCLHTMLKAEYLDESGVVCASLEPRKLRDALCLLYTAAGLKEPLILTALTETSDSRAAEMINSRFSDRTAVASTNDGVVWFLSDEQHAAYKRIRDEVEAELAAETEESFIGDEAPLFERINAKDFNVKRNLSASLDISEAREFGAEAPEETEEQLADEITPDETETVEETVQEDDSALKPDKLIMADGAVYSYFGELDESGNRSGFGRTLTDLGRTAYEGRYENDKRSGNGAYFYKDGTLCYSGDWLENARHGVGVGISARDGSIHTGRWVNNKPEGNGVRMSRDGELKFVCKELSDGQTVLMNYMADDTVVISKYDKNGAKIAEKTVSLTDF